MLNGTLPPISLSWRVSICDSNARDRSVSVINSCHTLITNTLHLPDHIVVLSELVQKHHAVLQEQQRVQDATSAAYAAHQDEHER